MSQSLEELQSKSICEVCGNCNDKRDAREIRQRFRRKISGMSELRFFGGSYSINQFLLQESDVGKIRDGGTSVTVEMGETRDRTVRDIYVTDP